jgi:hypothetical protein
MALCSQIKIIIEDNNYVKELETGEFSALTIYRRILKDRNDKIERVKKERLENIRMEVSNENLNI